MLTVVPDHGLSVPELSHERMTCMEVWGGNRSTWTSFVVPGLDIWVYSQPFDGSDNGGDVYYVSSCASGRITRMLVGDVSGHGTEAAALSTELHHIMRRNVNYVDQSRVVNGVNEQFEKAASAGRFATAVIATYFAPTRNLTWCSAGHPPPLIYRADSQEWTPQTADDPGHQNRLNIPFGIMTRQQYHSTNRKLSPGDMMLAYTDSFFEALDANGEMLRADGIAQLANSISHDDPGHFAMSLLNRVRELNSQNLAVDDTTLLLTRANSERVSLKENVLAPFRVLSGLFDNGASG